MWHDINSMSVGMPHWKSDQRVELLCFRSGNFVMTSCQDRSHPSLLWNKHN